MMTEEIIVESVYKCDRKIVIDNRAIFVTIEAVYPPSLCHWHAQMWRVFFDDE